MISHHSPIHLTINLNRHFRRTLWKLNSGILNNPLVKEELGKEIQTYFELNDTVEVNPPIVWDAFKAVMRGNITACTTHIKNSRQERLATLQLKLKLLQRKHKDYVESNTEQEIKADKYEIDEIYTQEIQEKLVYLKQKYWSG